MKILITGNMGYVGPGVIRRLRKTYPTAELVGYDTGYFAKCLTNVDIFPDVKLNSQIYGDVRNFDPALLNEVDAVIYLAAISNDPMGNRYEEITMDVNYRSAVKIARLAKEKGAGSFVFASSCSMYGEATGNPKVETDSLNPLTAYARSKVAAEKDLEPIAAENFVITCLRFATACGHSDRLRLDLVLNDFVAGAVTAKEIGILSDGTPWRPLIDVSDMAVAIDWAVARGAANGGKFVAVNTGSNEWNYQVKELAEAVAAVVPGVKTSVNPDAPPDKRSYRVNFDLFKTLAPDHQPQFDLKASIESLYKNLQEMNFSDRNFRSSQYIRLQMLKRLQEYNLLDETLSWSW